MIYTFANKNKVQVRDCMEEERIYIHAALSPCKLSVVTRVLRNVN